MGLTHLGHACVLYESGSTRLLLDPGTLSSGFSGLTDLTAVLVTHEHADHVDVPAVRSLLEANPDAALVTDERTAASFAGLASLHVARPGDRLALGGCPVAVLGGAHAPVYADVPDCPNLAYLLDDGAFFHPGDSFFVPPGSVHTLAVPIDGPWLKLAEAVDYVKAVAPEAVLPIHEGELTDVAKYVGMLTAFSSA